MTFLSFTRTTFALLYLFTTLAQASGMKPDTSVVIVDQGDGEGSINLTNTDSVPILLVTTLQDIPQDTESLLTVTPPVARVEPGKTQSVRFMLTSESPLKTERLKRVVFEGILPQHKGKNELRLVVAQNLPVLIRPAGLEIDTAPWKRLTWKMTGGHLVVSNPSRYVVRMSSGVQTLPDHTPWALQNNYVLPGETLSLSPEGKLSPIMPTQVRLQPGNTWGYMVGSYDAPLIK